MASSKFASEDARWIAVRDHNPQADGCFFTCVKTTKIFCRPTCRARLPRRANATFVDTIAEAEAAGYRACKRCKPEVANHVPEADQMISKVRNMLENLPVDKPLPKLDELAAQAGLTKYHFHRIFKRATGLSPREYALSRRHSRQAGHLRNDIGPSEDLAVATPSLFLDSLASSADGTPQFMDTPQFEMEDWLIAQPDDVADLDAHPYPLMVADEDTDVSPTETSPANLNKEVTSEELFTFTVYYSTIVVGQGLLLMAFEENQVSKLELVPSMNDAITSLSRTFPAPFYRLVALEELPDNDRVPLQQRVFAVAQAL